MKRILLLLTACLGILVLAAPAADEIKEAPLWSVSGRVLKSDQTPFGHGNVVLQHHLAEAVKSEFLPIAPDGTFSSGKLPAGNYSLAIDIHGASLSAPLLDQLGKFQLSGDRHLEIEVKPGLLDSILIFCADLRDFVWANWMIFLLVGTGILLTFYSRFIQVTRLGKALKYVLKPSSKKEKAAMQKLEGDISPFQALMTALAATVGNGNIAGVATAIAIGGPGAPFWMWVAGFFGMATKYAEGFLGVKYRTKNKKGEMAGGPMYYAREGIKNKKAGRFLGAAFAVLGGICALFGTGNMAQSNSMALALNVQFSIPFWITGIALAVLTGIVTIGGIKRIGEVSEKLVPTMVFFYIAGALAVILANFARIPEAFSIIFSSALTGQAATGALIGTSVQRAISIGVSRGVLSNESGMGSAAIAQAASTSPNPTYNGLVAMTGTFIDTIVVNTMTTLTIILSGFYLQTQAFGVSDGLTSTALTSAAFSSVIPFGGIIIAIGSLLFGYSTLIAWSYYGEKCLEYIFGIKIVMSYRFIFVGLIFVGAIIQGAHLNIIWYIGEISNAFMIIPNLLALLLLARLVIRETRQDIGKL